MIKKILLISFLVLCCNGLGCVDDDSDTCDGGPGKEMISAMSQYCSDGFIFEATPYIRVPNSLHPIIIVDKSCKKHRLTNCVPNDWNPESLDDIQLIGIMNNEDTKYLIEKCEYTPRGSIKRYGYKNDVTIIEARTGDIISSKTFYKDSPKSCPKSRSEMDDIEYKANHVSFNDIRDWLTGYVYN